MNDIFLLYRSSFLVLKSRSGCYQSTVQLVSYGLLGVVLLEPLGYRKHPGELLSDITNQNILIYF